MQAAKIDKRLQNSITLILLFLIIIFGMFFGVIKPQAQKLKTVNIDLAAKERELQAKKAKIEDLNKLKQDLSDIKTQSALLVKALPADADLPGLLVQVEAIANRLGINLADSGFSLPTAAAATTSASTAQTENLGAEPIGGSAIPTAATSYQIQEMSFSLNMFGDYSKLMGPGGFLSILQNNLRIFRINSIEIVAPSEEETRFSISTNISTFYIGKAQSQALSENSTLPNP